MGNESWGHCAGYAVTKSKSVDGKGRMIHAKFMRIRLLPLSPPSP